MRRDREPNPSPSVTGKKRWSDRPAREHRDPHTGTIEHRLHIENRQPVTGGENIAGKAWQRHQYLMSLRSINGLHLHSRDGSSRRMLNDFLTKSPKWCNKA